MSDLTNSTGSVHTHIHNGIGTIEFFHPKSNSLPGTLLLELAAAVTAHGDNPDVRVIHLCSGGTGAFCAGASFDELTAIQNAADGQAFFSGFAKVILAMIRAPKFIVTRVHGKAAGGAVGIIAASDLSFAVTGASAKLSELAIGIGPFVVGPVIERKIGLAAFCAMAVDAGWRDEQWGERHGLYSHLFHSTDDMDHALDVHLKQLALYSPEAMAQLKKVFWGDTGTWDSLLAERARMSGTMVLSDFTRQAISSFNRR